MCVFLLVLFCICVAFYPFPLSLLHNQMKISLLGRQASTPFSHGLSQPIDQCKSKPVTSGHDILWLNFKCAYRSESLCTCRQKHWGRRLTRNARRFQLHLRICQGASELCPLWARCGLDGRHTYVCLQPTAPFFECPTAHFVSTSIFKILISGYRHYPFINMNEMQAFCIGFSSLVCYCSPNLHRMAVK